MSDARRPGVVVDTMVVTWLLDDRPNQLAERYRQIIGSEPVVLAFQTSWSSVSAPFERAGANCDVGGWNAG